MSPLTLDQPALDQLHSALVNLLRESEAKCAVLVDQDGQCITKKGFTQHLDIDALAALTAGSFASTRAMAKLVGESEFTVLFHQGEKRLRDHAKAAIEPDRLLVVGHSGEGVRHAGLLPPHPLKELSADTAILIARIHEEPSEVPLFPSDDRRPKPD